MSRARIGVTAALGLLAATLPVTVPAPAATLVVTGAANMPDLDGNGDGGAGELAVLQAAIGCWEARIATDRSYTLDIAAASLMPGTLATGGLLTTDTDGVPLTGLLTIDNDGSQNWFVDPTPGDSVEFAPDLLSEWRFVNGPAATDTLTVFLHEVAHAMGWICGSTCVAANPNYALMLDPAFGAFVSNPACTQPFPLAGGAPLPGCVFLDDPVPPPFLVSLSGDGLGGSGQSVVNELSHPGVSDDLMFGFVSTGIRVLPSILDVTMFFHAYGDAINRPPTADAGINIVAECDAPGGATVTLDAGASADPDNDPLAFDWSCPGVSLGQPDAESTTGFFPLGATTPCRVEVTDLACGFNADAVDQVLVTVLDTTTPAVVCPADLALDSLDPAGIPAADPRIQAFLAAASVADACDRAVALNHDAPPTFAIGATPVAFSAQDANGNANGCVATVTVAYTPCTAPPSNMVGWWTFDGDARDFGAGRNDGSLQGGVGFGAGRVAEALALDGVDDRVDVGHDPELHVSPGEFTVDAWVRFNTLVHPPGGNNGPQGDMTIASKMSDSGINTDGWLLVKQDDNRFWFCLGGGSFNGCTATGANTVRSLTSAGVNTWYHVAALKSATEIALYVNGAKQASRPVPAFTDSDSVGLWIGADRRSLAHLNGSIDEVELHDRALAGAEIQAIYAAGPGGKCKDVLLEVSPPGSATPLSVEPASANNLLIAWEPTPGAASYRIVAGDLTALAGGAGVNAGNAAPRLCDIQTTSALVPAAAGSEFYLVAADNDNGTGPFGANSTGAPRAASVGCP